MRFQCISKIMRANKALCGKHFSLERFAPENICGPGHCAPQVPRLHRSYTPPMNCGCSDVTAPSVVSAKRVTDKKSRAEARFARLREHFSSRKCSISIRQTVCSLFPLPRATGTAGRCRLMHPKKIRPAVPLRFSRRSEASYRLRPDRRAPIARAVYPHPAFCEKNIN